MERFIKRMALIIYIILSFFRYPFPVIMTPFPQIVIQNGHKNTLRKKRETGWWNGVKNLLPWMTSYGFPHHSNRFFADALNDVLPIPSPRQPILHICFGWRLTFPSLWLLFLKSSFRTDTRMPCGKNGKRDGDTEWRIYYSDGVLPIPSLRQQILHIRFGWRLTFPSLWRFAVRRHSALLADSCRLTAFSSQLIAFIFLPAFLTIAADSSLTLWMTAYRFSHHGYRSFAAAQDDVLWSSSSRVQILHIRFGWRLTFPSLWRFAVRRHSERTQECLAEKTGNGMVTRSEESITLNDILRLPHHGHRFFADALNDSLPFSSSR